MFVVRLGPHLLATTSKFYHLSFAIFLLNTLKIWAILVAARLDVFKVGTWMDRAMATLASVSHLLAITSKF